MSNLYKCIYDPRETQIGFALLYFPEHVLGRNVRKQLRHSDLQLRYTKSELLERCSEDQTQLHACGSLWRIVWQNNAIPTETEWNKISVLRVHLRQTLLHGRVAILSRHPDCESRTPVANSHLINSDY